VTWTEFAAGRDRIYLGRPVERFGESFSPRVLVSRNSPLCTKHLRLPTPAGQLQPRTSSRSRSPDPTAHCTSCTRTSNNAVAGADNRNHYAAGQINGRWRHFRCPRQGC